MRINNEIKIGIMVVVSLVILFALTIKTGKYNFSQAGYYITMRFHDIDGVSLKSPVMYNGYEIGVVEDIVIKDDPSTQDTVVELKAFIDNQVKLREGTKAYVKNLGFMGDKYVGLTGGNTGGQYITSKSILVGEPPPSFDQLVSDGQVIATQLKEISINVNERLDKNKDNLDSILENINVTMKEMASLVENLDERLETNKDNVDGIVTNLHALSVNMEELSRDLKLNPWKLLYKGKEKKVDR